MKTMTRYVVIDVFRRSLFTLLIVFIIYTLFDVVELQSLADAPMTMFLARYVHKIPTIASQLLPLALSIGTALTVASLKQHGEWQAFNAVGISAVAICTTLLIVPAIAVGLQFVLLGYLAPKALATADSPLSASHGSPSPFEGVWTRNGPWMIEHDPAGHPLTVLRVAKGAKPVERFRRTDTGWKMWSPSSGWTHRSPPIRVPNVWTPPERLRPSGLGTFIGSADTLPRLVSAITALERMGHNTAPLEAELGLRVVLPMAAFLIPLATLLFNLRTEKGKSVYLTGEAIFATALFWLVTALLWNGVMIGVWQRDWLIIGTPTIYILILGLFWRGLRLITSKKH